MTVLRSMLGWTVLLATWVIPRVAHAETCADPTDCSSGFCVDGVCCDTECSAPCEACTAEKKGSGADGVCGLMPAGAVCAEAYCDESLAFVDDSVCDAAGECIAPAGVPCIVNDPCKLDLCGMDGCEQVIKRDGTRCGADLVCTDGACGPDMSSSASTGGGMGGSGGAPDGGGQGGGSPAGGTALYPPPAEGSGCGCRTTAGGSASGGVLAAWLAALLIRRGRRQKRSSEAPVGRVS